MSHLKYSSTSGALELLLLLLFFGVVRIKNFDLYHCVVCVFTLEEKWSVDCDNIFCEKHLLQVQNLQLLL